MWGEKNDVQAVLPAGAGVTREGTQDAGEVRQSAHMAEGYTHSDKRCHALNGWSRWWWASALVILLAVLGVPSAAYASESWGTVDGPFVTGQTANNEGYVVLNVGSQYDAALCVIGRGSDKIQLSNEQFAKLSNASTGGRFYEFAQAFTALGNDGTANHYVGWWGDTLYQANMVSLNGGYGHVWATETNQSKIASALEDYMVIYNGGSLGGGGSTPSNTYPAGYYYKISTNINNYAPFSANQSFGLKYVYWSVELYDEMKAEANRHGATIVLASKYNTANSSSLPGLNQWYSDWKLNYDSGYTFSHRNGDGYVSSGAAAQNFTIFGDLSRLYYKSGNLSFHWSFSQNYNTVTGPWYYVGAFNPDDFEKVYLDPNGNNWPDAPTPEPTPDPTVPEPSDVDLDVTFPSLSVTIDNDFTPDLQGILDAMDEHCQHLQRAIYNGLAGLFESLKEFEEGLYTHYVTYIHDVLEWLQDWFEMLQSDMDKIDIDISAINRYLYRILQEIGSNDGNATDVTGIESQLDTIIARLDALLVVESADAALDLAHFLLDLLGELLDTVGSVVSGVTEAFGDLTEVFPFSIPWDIAAIAALFAAEPVTPAFDIPFPAIAGGEGTLIHVDLSDFDGIASVGRAGILILFATGLALRTPQLMGVGSDDVA